MPISLGRGLWAALPLFVLGVTQGFAHDALPVGDGKVSNAPKQGFVFSCQQRFNPNAPGAQKSGPWLKSGQWIPALKPSVDGAVNWSNAQIAITLEGGERVVRANNLPKHKTGIFPVGRNDDAALFDRNPNRILAQKILLRLPSNPLPADEPSCVPMGMAGFALSGAAIYNALDARGEDAAAHEILDDCGGHPQQQGQYHYHNLSRCIADKLAGGHSGLIGYALDGFGLFGLYGQNGAALHNGDLDECHGHAHEIAWDGAARELYHYHFTDEYPYSIGCFRGKANASQAALQGGPQGGPPAGGRDALRKAAALLGLPESQLAEAVGPPPPDFAAAAGKLGIAEAKIRKAFGR